MGDKEAKYPKRQKPTNQREEARKVATPTAPATPKRAARPAANAREEVEKWCKTCLDKGVTGLRDEFAREIKRYVPADMQFEAFKVNHPAGRNRYQDVPCQDKGRIILKPPAPCDYIHANYVATPMSDKRFICTQGPLDNTLIDFWHMIIQEETDSIIMLCNVIEKGLLKCAQYWPNDVNTSVKPSDNIEVVNVEQRMMMADDQSIRLCVLKMKWDFGTPQEREVRHYQWIDWPDRGVPVIKGHTPTELLSRVRGTKKPIVVHCSAGIGRTGTIVAIEYTLERLLIGLPTLDMDKLLKEVRDQRPYTIQNDAQYLYIHRVLLNYFIVKYKHEGLRAKDVMEKYDRFVVDYEKATA
ncbi:unnamed protein product, partial [Mesorhabditis belari]|uniref:Uncharacterized protein n=1 Tax=Mesorhabditis belari TaxID=2138241 RepID=A0AAF3EJI7_9BILA